MYIYKGKEIHSVTVFECLTGHDRVGFFWIPNPLFPGISVFMRYLLELR